MLRIPLNPLPPTLVCEHHPKVDCVCHSLLFVKTQSSYSLSSRMSSNTFHFACPGSRHIISIGPQGECALNRTGDGPYPLLKVLEQRAVSNGSGSSTVSFADVFQNEVIWGSAIQASVLLNQHR